MTHTMTHIEKIAYHSLAVGWKAAQASWVPKSTAQGALYHVPNGTRLMVLPEPQM